MEEEGCLLMNGCVNVGRSFEQRTNEFVVEMKTSRGKVVGARFISVVLWPPDQLDEATAWQRIVCEAVIFTLAWQLITASVDNDLDHDPGIPSS